MIQRLPSSELENIEIVSKYPKIEKLIRWELREEVDRMLIQGVNANKVSQWCKDNGFNISKQKLYDYKDMMMRATASKITVAQLIGVEENRPVPTILRTLGMSPSQASDLVKSELDVLDAITQLGFNNMVKTKGAGIKMEHVLKAMELKHKLTGGAHGGLTNYGLDSLRELEEAKFEAIIKVVMKYIPATKLEEVQDAIAEAERIFYAEYAPEYLEEYDRETQRRAEEYEAGFIDESIIGQDYQGDRDSYDDDDEEIYDDEYEIEDDEY